MTRLTYLRLNLAIRVIAILAVLLGVAAGFACADPWEIGNLWWSEDPMARLSSTLIIAGALVELLARLYADPKDLAVMRRLGGVLERVARSDRSRAMKVVATPVALMGYGLRVIGLIVGILIVTLELFEGVLDVLYWVSG